VPEEILAMILAKLKKIAETYLDGQIVKNALISVPSYFNHFQRQSIINSADIAGLNIIVRLASTLASIPYGLNNRNEGEKNVLIFNWGGGTLNISLLTFDDFVFEEKAISGDTHL
jgi:L1 cell adhesion molecule like protein